MNKAIRFFSLGLLLSSQFSFSQDSGYIKYNPNNSNKPTKVYTAGDNKEMLTSNSTTDTVILMKNTVSIHPALMIDGTVAIGYERVLSERKQAARIILGYSKLDNSVFYDSKIKDLEQVYAELNFKFFLSRKNKTAPVGLYACPFVQFRKASYTFEVDTLPYNSSPDLVKLENLESYSFAGGVMLGYSTIVLEMLTLEVYAGVGQQSVNGDYKLNVAKTEYKPLETGFFWNNGPLLKLGGSIGVNF